MDNFSQFYGFTKKSVNLTVGQFLHVRIFKLLRWKYESDRSICTTFWELQYLWDRTIQLMCRMMLPFVSVGRHDPKKACKHKFVGYLRLAKTFFVPLKFKCHFHWSHLFWKYEKRSWSLFPQRGSQNSQITTSSSLGSYNPIGVLHDAPFCFYG